MPRYLYVRATSTPFDLGVLDSEQRVVYMCRYDTEIAGGTSRPCNEIAGKLISAGLGTTSNILIGSSAVLPKDNDGPFIHIRANGGYSTNENHNGGRYTRPQIQVAVHAKKHSVAEAKAFAIHAVLDALKEETLTAA